MADDQNFNTIDWHQAQGLADFLVQAEAQALSPDAQCQVLDAAAALLERHYAHLPQKRVSQGTDPVARLRAMRAEFGANPMAAPLGVPDFHEALCDVFSDLRDLHTAYLLPRPFAGMVAFLPFQIGLLADPAAPTAAPRVIVTHVLPGFTRAPFAPGVEIVSWSGVAVARALRRLAARTGGANPAAASARAVAALTQRPLLRLPPPEEAWVEIGYRAGDTGPTTALRLAWRVCPVAAEPPHQQPAPPPRPAEPHRDAAPHLAATLHLAMDIEGDVLRRHRKQAYAPHVLAAEHAGQAPAPGAAMAGHPFEGDIQTPFGDLRAWAGAIDGQRFGVLRIRGFKLPEQIFLDEIRRLLSLLPPEGLIIDIRDNPGGLVAAAERMLQFLTDTPIEPVRVQLLATPANLALCEAQSPQAGAAPPRIDLSAWVPSLRDAIAAGRPWSDAAPMTPLDDCRDIGRVYPGPVVLITSARSYSAADIFTAGFRDNAIGRILGVDGDTGAGGANMWTFSQVALLSGAAAPALPQGVELRVAVRRVLRAGTGEVLEEAGIIPDEEHRLTRRDLLENDPDLIAHAVAMLAPSRSPDH